MDDLQKKYSDWQFVGKGSFGTVYRVKQNGIELALKLIRTDVLSQSAKSRLDYEIKAIQKVQHPNVVKLRDYGSYTENFIDYVYIVMDFVEGNPLTTYVGTLDENATKNIIKSLILTLEGVHNDGILHRDLKPDNVMIKPDGTPIILDLGLAKLIDYSSITQTGDRIGTYYYMSPEQVTDSKNIDERSDYFAIGVIAYQLITGVLPYDATNLPELIEQIKNAYPRNPSTLNSLISNDFENLILKMLEKDPHRRYQKVAEIVSVLENEAIVPDRKLDLSIRFYLRMNHNDKTLFSEAYKAGIIDHIIYPASYFEKNHPTVDVIKKSSGIVFSTDPATDRMAYSSFSKTKGVIDLPYSSGSPVKPTVVKDFVLIVQIQEFVKKVLDYQSNHGVNELCAPFFFARNTSDPWYEINIKLAREAVAYRNEQFKDKPIWVGLCMNVDGWYDESEKKRILNDYVRIEADGYITYGDPIGKSSNLTQMYHYSDLLLTLQSSSGAPVVASRVNGLGLVLVAFGLSGTSSGAASLDSFREEILSDTQEGYTNDPRYYIPELMSMVSLPKKSDAKIKDIKRTSIGKDLECSCTYCNSLNAGTVVPSDVKLHHLFRKKQELDEMSGLNSDQKIELITNKINTAINFEATLKKEGVKLGNMPEIQTLRDLVVELKKR